MLQGGKRINGTYNLQSSKAQPIVSVITVVWNSEKLLERTINSVLEQTYTNIEYIIIDGGSEKGTLDIIKKYEDKIAYWMSEKDKGLYDAMNKGLQLATGDYVWFINSGDAIYDNETTANAIANANDADIIYGDTILVNETYQPIGLRGATHHNNCPIGLR
jgi:Glycosyltransferases involved in cell wall biogenesis